MRPILKPALPRLWRDEATLQFGADPTRAVVLAGVSAAVRRVLDLLDGTRDRAGVAAAAATAGVDARLAHEVIDRLAAAGLLDDAGADTAVLRALEVADRDRLAPELAALSLLHPAPGAALRVLAGRRACHVAVLGSLPLAAELARLLVAAGVGRVSTHADAGRLLAVSGSRQLPDLVVVTAYGLVGLDVVDAVERLAGPHLAVVIRDLTGVVGPLVRPGASSCLRCHDLHRADRDPGWPVVAMQLGGTPPTAPPYSAALAAVLAGTAALQVLAFLDGEQAATLDGTLELRLPDWRLRRRSWTPHPDCGCGLARAG